MLDENYTEKELEDYLLRNPYLISTKFSRLKSQYRIILKSGETRYIDLLHFDESEITVIELKKDTIKFDHLGQLAEYVHHFENTHPTNIVMGIMIGSKIDQYELQRLSDSNLKYMEIPQDIPIDVKICDNCRKVVRKIKSICNWCGSTKFID